MLKYQDLTERNYRKNRTIVSDEIESLLLDVGDAIGLPLEVVRYPSGTDVGTWHVPPSWNVNEAWIKGPDGSTVASYAEHPLFLVPYSQPFRGLVDLEELGRHVQHHPTRPDDFYYEHRFAYDFRRRLSDWAVTLPRSRFERLPAGEYEVHLDIDVVPGEMLIGRVVLPGQSAKRIVLACDHCHPGQVNDSWSGVLAMIDVIKALSARKDRYHTFEFLIFPETIGSCVHLESHAKDLPAIRAAIFSEFVGWGGQWRILAGERRQGLATRVAGLAAQRHDDVEVRPLHDGYTNDEAIYDYVGVPAFSVQRVDCEEYHSSSDSPELLEQDSIDKAAGLILQLCDLLERDRVYQPQQRVPVYLTRYDLYADATRERQDFVRNRQILRGLNDGLSLTEIAVQTGVDFDDVCDYVDRLAAHDLFRPVQ